jgi:hypothetical protein
MHLLSLFPQRNHTRVMVYQEIGKLYLKVYKIKHCPADKCDCWERPHAHTEADDRKICKMPLPKGRYSLFEWLHEVGHIEHPRGGRKREYRSVEEFYATQYAKQEMKNLGIPIPRRMVRDYNQYITDCLERGLKHGMKKIPREVRHLKPKRFKVLRKLLKFIKSYTII